MSPGDERPQLIRVGSGRPVRLGIVVAVGLLAGAVGLGLADRLPSDSRPRPSIALRDASPAPTPTAAAVLRDLPSAFDRGNGWPPRPHPDSAARLELRLVSYQLVLDQVSITRAGGEATGRLAVPASTWSTPAWVQLRWGSALPGDDGQQLAMVALRRGSPMVSGRPIELATGQALLPRQMYGTRHWDYMLTLERAVAQGADDEWVAAVRLTAAEAPPARPSVQSAPMILLVGSVGHPQRASRTHGHSWVAGR